MNAIEEITSFLEQHITETARDDYHLFEPWDVEERPDWLYELAEQDDIDLRSPENIKLYGSTPHPFQTGFMTFEGTIGVMFAGNRVGKSYCAIVDMIMKATGDLPYAFRYPKGFDTGIARKISESNIRRFGRYDLEGKFLDRNDKAYDDGTWNCGNVKGAGLYPDDLIIANNAEALKVIWVCTKKQAWEEFWWKKFKDVIPNYMIDHTKGIDGFSEKKRCVYLVGGFEIHGLTYDQGAPSFEAVEVPYLYMDEEAPMAVYAAALLHCTRMRIIETPYKGITWTYDMLLLRSTDPDSSITVYHATQYDSPYLTKEWIDDRRKYIKRWEVKARIWGIHSDQQGRPFYEEYMDVLRRWSLTASNNAIYVEFKPLQSFTNYREACYLTIRPEPVPEDLERGQWHMYEKVESKLSYFISADTAEGSEDDEQAAQDRSSAIVWREPKAGENPYFPVIVAACRSSDSTINFARECIYAAVYYNNALLAPEVRGETGGTFKTEVREYPFLFTMSVINDKTKKPTNKVGYVTSAGNRQQIFDYAGDYLAEFADDIKTRIPYLPLIKEMMACIVGKKGKPDHPRNGTTDTLIAFGVGIYVFQVERNQIRNNKRTKAEMDAKTKEWYEGRNISTKRRNEKAIFVKRR